MAFADICKISEIGPVREGYILKTLSNSDKPLTVREQSGAYEI
jgi:hypothetical protein